MLPKNLTTFVAPMLVMARKQFPRNCPGCGRRYEDFEQYIQETTPAGTTLNYPFDQTGMIAWVRCRCGNQLTLRCEEMAAENHRLFVSALESESKAGGRTVDSLMSEIRDEVRRLAEQKTSR